MLFKLPEFQLWCLKLPFWKFGVNNQFQQPFCALYYTSRVVALIAALAQFSHRLSNPKSSYTRSSSGRISNTNGQQNYYNLWSTQWPLCVHIIPYIMKPDDALWGTIFLVFFTACAQVFRSRRKSLQSIPSQWWHYVDHIVSHWG